MSPDEIRVTHPGAKFEWVDEAPHWRITRSDGTTILLTAYEIEWVVRDIKDWNKVLHERLRNIDLLEFEP